MSVAENVKRVVEEKEETMKGSSEYKELSVFYAKMKEMGLAQKQEYTIPPFNCTGHGCER